VLPLTQHCSLHTARPHRLQTSHTGLAMVVSRLGAGLPGYHTRRQSNTPLFGKLSSPKMAH
jgi:hypothetical protein